MLKGGAMLLRKKKKNGGIVAAIKKIAGAADSGQALEDLEELLLGSDVGVKTASSIVDALEKAGSKKASSEHLLELAAEEIRQRLAEYEFTFEQDRLTILLVLGVNGVGKTTTIAKLAHRFKQHHGIDGLSLAAGDTFRAGAVRQLQLHGERLKIRVVGQTEGADSAAVVFDAVDSALARHDQLLIVDTAGRMHNKKHLVEELAKIDRVIQRKAPQARIMRMLVVDATTGQNALRQAEVFSEAVGIDFAVITKYDSTAKAGIAVALNNDLGIPVAFLGLGEGYDDLIPFSIESYVQDILD